MVAKGVAASTLVRSLRRFAVPESVADAVANANGSISTHGLVLGTENDPGAAEDEVAIWGVVRDLDKSASVLPYVPTGISVLGSFSAWVRGDGGHDDEDAEREAAATIAKEGLSAAKNLSPRVALVYVHETQRLHLFDYDAKPLPLEIIGCLHASDFVQATGHALLRASVSFEASSKQEVATFLERSVPYFVFPERRQSIFNAEGVEVTRSESTSTSKDLRDLVKVPEKRVVASKSKKKKATSGNDNWDSSAKASNAISGGDFLAVDPGAGIESGYIKTLEYGEVADVQVLRNLGASSSLAGIAPVLEIRAPGQNVQVQPVRVTADALVVAPISAPVAKIVANLRDELAKQVSRLTAEWKSSITMLRTDHFALLGASFPLSLPTVDRELSAAVATSKVLSEQFVQPENQPLFVPNKCSLSVQAASLAEIDVLFNVHEGIPPSGIPNGTQYLVDGFYGYYHYMQQAMNDKGWGCAYRSLQTLASWLFWNHYTATPTLSHRKIQETLVAIGDKPSTFVGSREWIGSMEVGFVLDELFGISFRTINANNGQQLVEKAQELKHHFETQGTPVMMGGGQLAFTLLGIDYNASSGECAFLILDPHYVGPEDLETIQTKTMPLEGYKAVPCGWRKASTFSKTSFYNLCLPQRPHME